MRAVICLCLPPYKPSSSTVRECVRVRMRVWRKGVLWGYSWGDYHVKRLVEAPSLFVASRLSSRPSFLSDPFLASSSFLSILPGLRRVTRSVTGITHGFSSREPRVSRTNEQKWLTLVAWWNMSISRFSEEIWNEVFLLPLRHREAI